MTQAQRNRRLAYALALLLPMLVLLARVAFTSDAVRPSLILFVVPVTICAFLGGLRPGLLCMAFSAVLAAYFLLTPHFSFAIQSSLDRVQWLMFIVAGGLISYFAERLLKSQERLRVDESRLSGIFNSAMDGIVTVDENLTIRYANPAAESMFGRPVAELVGMSGYQLVPEAHQRLCVRLIKQLAVSGALHRFVEQSVKGVRANGDEFPIETTISRVEIEGTQHFTLVIRDVSERRIVEDALREREALYRSLFESLDEGVVLWDTDGRLEACNPAAERILGWTLAEIQGLHYSEVPWRPNIPKTTEFATQQLSVGIIQSTGEQLLHRERKVTRRDGQEIWILQNGIPMPTFDKDTQPKVLMSFSDITERQKSAEAQAQMAAIVANSEDAIITTSLEGVVRTWNPGAEHVLGYTAGGAIGQQLHKLLLPADQVEMHMALRLRLARGEPVDRMDIVFVHKGGRALRMSATFSPLRDARGSITGISVIARDVTARRQAEEALRESEERFRIVADAAPVLLWMSDASRCATYFNTGWLNFTGRMLEQELNHGWTADVHPDDLSNMLAVFNAAIDARVEFRYEFRLKRHDGAYRWIFSVARPRSNAGGSFAGYIGTGVDINDRREAEDAIRARDAAQDASRLKSEFLATMSHELRTPLTGVIGFAEYLRAGQAGSINEEQLECLDSIHKSSLHLLDLINGILDLSKIEAGKMELTPETFSVPDVVEEVCGVISPMAMKKRIRVQRQVVPQLSAVTLDRAKFKQVLYNLLSNAVKFTEDGGRIEVAVDTPRLAHLCIRVTDTGVGIDPKDTVKLFQSFQQLDNSITRRHEGAGLGLALTKKIVELQQGMITVESAVGRGSVFTVTLPY